MISNEFECLSPVISVINRRNAIINTPSALIDVDCYASRAKIYILHKDNLCFIDKYIYIRNSVVYWNSHKINLPPPGEVA